MVRRALIVLALCCGLSACSGRIDAPNSAALPGDAPGAPRVGSGTAPEGASGNSAGSDPRGGTNADPPAQPIGEDAVAACAERVLSEQPLRRLSSTQYANTLRDLFGPALAAPMRGGSRFPATVIEAGFSGDAEANTVNSAESNAIEDNAERIAALVLENPDPFLSALMPCAIGQATRDADIDGCVGEFIDGFGLRAYRRPLQAGEREIARALYDAVRAEQSALEAWSALLQLFVQAPALLYRVERGAGEVMPGLLRLTDYEMASRLSYFLTESMPDGELLEAAAAGELSTAAQVEAQARRLMQTRGFEAVLSAFHRDWLHLYELPRVDKDRALFPEYTDAVRSALLEEASRLVSHVLEQGEGSVRELLGSSSIPVNAELAAFYGVEAPGATASRWVAVELPDRRGIATLASFMAAQADADATNPIHRGAFFQREILCNALPSLPGNIDIQTPLRDTSGLPTARERLSPLLSTQPCSGCHQNFNPTGLALENFDAVGLWRDQENGSDIDASGSLTLDQQEHAFSGPLELMALVAESRQAEQCYTRQWYRNALGRRDVAEDACSLALANERVRASGGDLRELLVAITQTDGFLYRRVPEEP